MEWKSVTDRLNQRFPIPIGFRISSGNSLQNHTSGCELNETYMCIYVHTYPLVDPLTLPEVKIIEMAGSSFIDLENRP